MFSAKGLPNIGDDSKDYDDYEGVNAVENDADKETRSFPTPKFISESSHILVNEGDTVRMILYGHSFEFREYEIQSRDEW